MNERNAANQKRSGEGGGAGLKKGAAGVGANSSACARRGFVIGFSETRLLPGSHSEPCEKDARCELRAASGAEVRGLARST